MNSKNLKKKKEKFTFRRSYFESIEEMPKEKQLEIYRAVANYALNGEVTNLKDSAGAVFNLIKASLDDHKGIL